MLVWRALDTLMESLTEFFRSWMNSKLWEGTTRRDSCRLWNHLAPCSGLSQGTGKGHLNGREHQALMPIMTLATHKKKITWFLRESSSQQTAWMKPIA